MPPALLLIGVGSAKVVSDVVTNPVAIAINTILTILLIMAGLIIGSMGLFARPDRAVAGTWPLYALCRGVP